MNLTKIRSVVAAFHRYPGGLSTLLGSDGTDLFLNAVNNARRNLELLHNFEYTRLNALLDIDGLVGGALAYAQIEDPQTLTPASGVVPQVSVAGTLSPDFTGTFTSQGNVFGQPFYVMPLADGTEAFLYYNLAAGAYYLSQLVANGDNTTAWANVTTGPVVQGTYAPVDGGFYTGNPVVTNTSVWKGIKEVVAVMRRRPDGTYIPLDFARADIPIELDRTELEFSDNLFPYLRYPSDAQINARGTNSAIIQRGKNLYIYPRYTSGVDAVFQVQLEAFGWLPDYTPSDYTVENKDFLVESGSDYLQWSAICELNYIYQTYVPRAEGNPGTPESKLAAAQQRLIDWDSYLVDSNTTRSR